MRGAVNGGERPGKFCFLMANPLLQKGGFCYNSNIMLQSENRLTKVRDFNLVMKHGRWVSGRFLRIKWLKLADFEKYFPRKEDVDKFKKQLRLAVVVGVKVSKGAVKRNRLKRQMREVVRLLIKEGRLPDGYYLMVVAQKEMLDKNYAEISEEIRLLLEKIFGKY